MEDHHTIITNYVHAYNTFDIEGMLTDMHEEVVFKNISNGEVTLTTHGIDALRQQAERAKYFFAHREQKIVNISFRTDEAEVFIHYTGVLALDLPNGSKAGDKLVMNGKSVFKFSNNKIVELTDIS